MNYSDQELYWVFNRSGGRCLYCGSEIAYHAYQDFGLEAAWVVDNFVPAVHGGADNIFNWVAACPACSYHKEGRAPWEFDPERFREGVMEPEALKAKGADADEEIDISGTYPYFSVPTEK